MYKYQFNEEIARWTLEVHLNNDPTARSNWWIAFTNPTAGPWKRLVARDGDTEVEVYRYAREEDRPDLVIVNDEAKLILVIEAKDLWSKLISPKQMAKSIKVIEEMELQLKAIDKPAWANRRHYGFVAGFLWGQSTNMTKEVEAVENAYRGTTRTRLSAPAAFFLVKQENDTDDLKVFFSLRGICSVTETMMSHSLNLPIGVSK